MSIIFEKIGTRVRGGDKKKELLPFHLPGKRDHEWHPEVCRANKCPSCCACTSKQKPCAVCLSATPRNSTDSENGPMDDVAFFQKLLSNAPAAASVRLAERLVHKCKVKISAIAAVAAVASGFEVVENADSVPVCGEEEEVVEAPEEELGGSAVIVEKSN